MHGRRSRLPTLVPLNLELERTRRRLGALSLDSHLRVDSPTTPMANPPPPRPLKEYFTPTTYESPSCIQLSEVAATHFEIKPRTIQMLPNFFGLKDEDPYKDRKSTRLNSSH